MCIEMVQFTNCSPIDRVCLSFLFTNFGKIKNKLITKSMHHEDTITLYSNVKVGQAYHYYVPTEGRRELGGWGVGKYD